MNDREWAAQDPGKRELPQAHTDNAPIGYTDHEKSAWSYGYEEGRDAAIAEMQEEADVHNVPPHSESATLWSMLAKYGIEPTDDYMGLLSMHVIAVQEREDAYKRINRLSQALREIHGISQGSATANSLQHLAQIAGDALGY